MSHIPNSAMPHARAEAEGSSQPGPESRLGQLAELAREHPKTSMAAGAALAAGVAAAAATALRARGRRKN